MRKTIFALASCAALMGCGAGGGSGSGSVAVIGGSSTGGGTPTPTGGVLTTGEVKPTAGATFIAATMDLSTSGGVAETNGTITGGSTAGRTTTFDTPQFSASYDPSTGYRLADAVNAASFGRNQLTSDTTAPNGNGIVLFTSIVGSTEDYLALYQQSTYSSNLKGSGYTTAIYGGTAGWQHTVVSGSSRQTRLDYLAYGPATPLTAMPRSGVVRFTVLSSGNYATDSDLWFLSSVNGNVINVDFSTGAVSGNILPAGQNFYKNVTGGIGSIPLNGTFSGNSLTASFNNASLGTSGGVPGQFHLLFVGPNADELIVTFVARDAAQAAVGAVVAVRDPHLN